MPKIPNLFTGEGFNIVKEIEFATGIEEPLAIYRIRKDSLSRNKLSALRYQWKVYRELEKLGYLKSLYYSLNWMIRGFLKYRT